MVYNITKFRQNIVQSIKKHQNKNNCVQLYCIHMVIFNFTKIYPLFLFNFASVYCASEHCAVTCELSKLGDWPIVHRDDNSLGARELISRFIGIKLLTVTIISLYTKFVLVLHGICFYFRARLVSIHQSIFICLL